MGLLLFVIVYPLVWLLSSLPMRLLYVLSDFLHILIYYVFGYRKKVVCKNIELSFPDLSESERKQLVKKFYHHFLDLMVESIKAFTISKKEIQKRYVYNGRTQPPLQSQCTGPYGRRFFFNRRRFTG